MGQEKFIFNRKLYHSKALAKRNASHRKSTQVLTCEDLRSLAIGWPNATQVEHKSFAKVAEFLFFFFFFFFTAALPTELQGQTGAGRGN